MELVVWIAIFIGSYFGITNSTCKKNKKTPFQK